MQNDISKYYEIAEKVYQEIFVDSQKYVSQDKIHTLNNILIKVIKYAAEYQIKITYSYINFEECLNIPITERVIKIDLSLFGMLTTRDELVPWLMKFIQSISLSNQASQKWYIG